MRNPNLLSIACFAILFMILTSCSKESSRKWLVGDVYVVDAVTGEPIQTYAEITYSYNPIVGEVGTMIVDLGNTGVDGHISFEEEIGGGNFGYDLAVWIPSMYGNPGLISWMKKRVSLKAKGHNNIVIPLQPRYPFRLRMVNANCTAPTDSMWLSYNNGVGQLEAILVGCADSILIQSFSPSYTSICESDEVTFSITTKKSGVVQTFSETHGLLPAEVKSILINY